MIGASLLVHALILGGLPGWNWAPRSPSDKSLNIVLAPVVIEKKQAPAAQIPKTPARKPVMAPRRTAPVRPTRPTRRESSLAPPATEISTVPQPITGTPASGPVESLPPAEPVRPVETSQSAEAPPAPQVLLPGSATLNYKVTATEMRKDPPTVYHGEGMIAWKVGGEDKGGNKPQYRLDLQARLNLVFLSLSVLTSHSEGEIDPSGLQPRRYTETPRNKSTLAVNFNRDERNSVTFSAASNSLPLLPGVQDRLSVLLQIGALVRATPEQARASSAIEIPVAGTRGEIDPWRFAVLGSETVETGAGAFQALHLKRSPRPSAGQASREQSIDIWIATGPEVQAYPVKILFTEPNSNRYELTLESIE